MHNVHVHNAGIRYALPLVPEIVSLPRDCCYGDRVSVPAVTLLSLLYEGAEPGSGLLGDTE